ncbi:adenylate kinase family protein [Aspergillus niger]|uniref:Adenylate kinase family protein n=1 Tax=Aspergillus niger TaxID=5061 RepID=A0A505IH18_ASPNG|nr:adenylate kinase family protein [Aspergillus niger]
MGDNNQATTGFDPAANAPDAAAWDKGKGKATDPTQDMRMDDDESDESEAEEMIDDDDDEDNDTLEPISSDNIISGGRRTRGKTIDFQAAAENSHVPTYTSAILVPPRPFLIHTVAVPDPPVNPRAAGGFRSATPNAKGHYSDAVLSHLESQNDAEVEGISAKVKMLKDLTVAIGDEIRDTSTISDLNNTFENTRVRLRGNMNRMLRMAERTGVSWKVWLAFFFAVFLLFFYVWLT